MENKIITNALVGAADRKTQLMKQKTVIADLLQAEHSDGGAGWEKFLADEGLELLAAYRAIEDKQVRFAFLQLARALATGGDVGPLN